MTGHHLLLEETSHCGVSFVDPDIRDIQFRSISSSELNILKFKYLQAMGLACLLVVEIEDRDILQKIYIFRKKS